MSPLGSHGLGVKTDMHGPTAGKLLELQQTLYTSSNPTRRALHEVRRDWIFDTIRRYGQPIGGHAIEIGPGSGVYLPVLAQAFEHIFATDIEPEFLAAAEALASRWTNISVCVDDVVRSNLPSQTFDLVLCTEVIEHIADSVAALATMHRILRPGGVLVLSTPQRYSTLELAAKLAFLPGVIDIVRRIYKEPIIETGHINLLTARAARRQLSDAGFRIDEAFVSGLYLPLIAEFLGTLGRDFEQACETWLKRIGFTGILWTQYYVATSPAA
jgi:SAM-dependent methyltransferase